MKAEPRASFRWISRVDAWVNRVYGSRLNPLYHSGAITIVMLAVLLVTGLYLLLFYRIGAPWESVARLHAQPWAAGRWVFRWVAAVFRLWSGPRAQPW